MYVSRVFRRGCSSRLTCRLYPPLQPLALRPVFFAGTESNNEVGFSRPRGLMAPCAALEWRTQSRGRNGRVLQAATAMREVRTCHGTITKHVCLAILEEADPEPCARVVDTVADDVG